MTDKQIRLSKDFPFRIYVIDGATDSLDSIRYLSAASSCAGAAVLNNRGDRLYLFASDSTGDESYLLFLDCERNQIIQEMRVDFIWGKSAYNPIGNRLYAIGPVGESQKITVIDSISFPEDKYVGEIKFVPRHNRLYCFLDFDTLVAVNKG